MGAASLVARADDVGVRVEHVGPLIQVGRIRNDGLEVDRPADWANAIKEAVNSVEAVLRIIYSRPGESLTTIVREELPEDVPGNIKGLFKSLYGQGSGTVGARHASIGGNNPSGPRAELAIHVAAALHAYAASELDST